MIPPVALSVRQPWAWAIIHAGKDIENRTDGSVRSGSMSDYVGKRIAIHAAKGMTRDEYEDAFDFMKMMGVDCPAAADLQRGGIIGSVRLKAITRSSNSPWFFGPMGLVVVEPEPCDFVGAKGNLGMFQWEPNDKRPDPAASWMSRQKVEGTLL